MLRGGGGGGRGIGGRWRRRPRPLLDDGLSLGGDDLLGTPVQLGVLDEAVAVREPGAALLTAVGLVALQRQPTGKKDGGVRCRETRTQDLRAFQDSRNVYCAQKESVS